MKTTLSRLIINNFAVIFIISGVLCVSAQTGTVKIFDAPWRGFDTGIFGSGFAPSSFAFGDLDADGDLDALVGDSFGNGGSGVTVLKNNGDKTFAAPVFYAIPDWHALGDVALTDFDGDGDLDAVASVRGNSDDQTSVRVWRNNGDGTFAASTQFTTGQGPFGIVAADFNGDGKPDIATANYGAHSVSVLKHNGQTGAGAGLLSPVHFPLSTWAQMIAAADVNGDGKTDLAVGGFNVDTNEVWHSILINDGTGNFAAPVNYRSAPDSRLFSYAVALGDLDNDGDADLMGGGVYSEGSSDYGALTVRRNNGSGAFGNAEIYRFEIGVPSPRKIKIGDLNGDGFPDIIAATPSGRTTDGYEVLLNNGAGGFTPKHYEASQQTFDAAAVDIDRDNDLDVLTLANSSAALTVHLNPGSGVFPVPVRNAVAAFPDAVESADIDNDGDIDIVVNGEVNIASNDAVVKILKNNGDGTFAPAADYSPPRNFADMKLRDINNDGFVDLVFAPDGNYPPYHLGTALNNGDGTFAPTVVIFLNGCGSGSIDAADMDGDRDRDIVFVEDESCRTTPARIFVVRNNGNQNFTILPPIIPPGLTHGVALADATGDGRLDVITAVSGSMAVYPGNGDLGFGAPILSTSEPYLFTTADFNNDGKIDLGMIMPQDAFGTDTIATALGNGNGTFQAIRTQTGSSVLENLRISSDLDAADFNGDGKTDLLVYNFASNDVSLFLNAGDGAIHPQQRYGIGSTPNLGTAADFNGDGRIDIAATIGLPPVGLQSAVVILPNLLRRASRKAPFDFDGDGKTDVGIFRPSDGSWWYLRSSDNASRVFRFGDSSDNLAPGDFTGDGKADIAVFRASSGTWFIQRSEDNSFFSFPFGAAGDIAAPADYDGDGKTDAAVFRPSSGTWFILNSGGSGTSIVNFGSPEDKPVTADYDGDGKSDIAIFRPSDGSWWYLQSSDQQFKVFRFGVSTDKPVPGDYTGDGKADIAVFRPATGEWFVQRSEDNSYFSFTWGQSGDIPAPGDYDGDGKTDAAILRPTGSTWYINQTSSGVGIVPFGSDGDRPIANAFIP